MAAMSAVMLWGVLVSVCFAFSSADQKNITAEPGQNATLPCGTADNKPPVAVEWRRSGLGKQYVLLFRDDQIDEENQLLFYRNRVDLVDRKMMNGNVSLLLKNVTTSDNGSYVCGAQYKGSLEIKPITTIQLNVLPPGNKNYTRKQVPSKVEGHYGSVGLTVVLSYLLLLVFNI